MGFILQQVDTTLAIINSKICLSFVIKYLNWHDGDDLVAGNVEFVSSPFFESKPYMETLPEKEKRRVQINSIAEDDSSIWV